MGAPLREMPAALLLDNDGVLVGTEPLYCRASQEALATLGVALSPADFAEISLRQGGSVFLLAERAGVAPDRIAAARELRNRLYSRHLREAPDLLLPGVQEALRRLRPHIPVMGIVSNALPEHFALIHGRTGLLPLFDFHLVAGDVARGKPHPDPYLAALGRAGVSASRAIAIEDNERGLRSALAAGLRCLVVPPGPWQDGDFPGALAVCPALAQAAELILGGAAD